MQIIKDSYCGLYCGACEILNAFLRQLNSGIEAQWEQLPKEISTHIAKDEIKCYGCKSDIVFAGCSKCKIRECAKQNSIDYCYECNRYPCTNISDMQTNLKQMENAMPHTKAIISNMEIIKKIGKRKWIESQELYWKCSHCGTSTTWYQRECFDCGNILKHKAY
jgi:DNA mismatch repair ATPase MutS